MPEEEQEISLHHMLKVAEKKRIVNVGALNYRNIIYPNIIHSLVKECKYSTLLIQSLPLDHIMMHFNQVYILKTNLKIYLDCNLLSVFKSGNNDIPGEPLTSSISQTEQLCVAVML
jgi:hypothetical protein